MVRRNKTGEDATEVVVQEGRARSGERVNEEVRAVDEGRHEDEESTVAGVEFVTTKSLTGRIFHSFISENYKFAISDWSNLMGKVILYAVTPGVKQDSGPPTRQVRKILSPSTWILLMHIVFLMAYYTRYRSTGNWYSLLVLGLNTN